ncbi:hypothetical protein [Streptomyces aidingensis]|uniref:Uncharacterized protein n=1 Tax=Streptomyces aidingensis TaxID=910347 RepID=A0A1I1PXD6_9ACTN|nr:hypothetical protein [Streptomyces aidingensis]SFD14445.1 hypothetical protein SAMN05421773_110117 [Streptomyces aidingensis]
MTLDATQVRVGITGEVYRAPAGTAAPTGPTTALDAAFEGLGYVSEDGVTEAHDDSVDNIVAWQGATVVRSAVTESVMTLAFTLIQTNTVTLETFHRGSTMTEPTPGVFKLEVKPPTADPGVWVLDVIDGDKHERIYLGNAEITERGELMYANGEPIGYPITITAYPDTDGNLAVKWSDDPAWGESLGS